MKYFLLLIMSIFVLPLSANAQTKYDSFYYMKDDGVFSDDEKDDEAQKIYQKCNQNDTYNKYFDCACVAGTFRVERDGSLKPQDMILLEIYNDRNTPCVNTVGIAGLNYETCLSSHSNNYTLLRKKIDPNEMCECYANHVAISYKKKPHFDSNYISNLRSKAYLHCIQPESERVKVPTTLAELEAQQKLEKERLRQREEDKETLVLDNSEEKIRNDKP